MAAYRHYGCRITDDLVYKGMRALFLENDLLRIGILLDKGADLFQFLHKPTDTDFLWRSPLGLRDPQRTVATSASAAGAFLDGYHGGWQECLPGGGPFAYRGAEIGLHGEVTNLGWECRIVKDSAEEIEVELEVECVRTPLRLVRRMRLVLGCPSLFIQEELTNLSPEALEFMWGHHPAFGAPFLSDKVRLFIPAGQVQVHTPQFAESGIFTPGAISEWPMIDAGGRSIDLRNVAAPDAGYADLLYLSRLEAGWYALLDTERRVGFGLAWQPEVMPYLWFWLVYGRAPGYPWWSRTYCIALEPWTSIPNSFAEACTHGTQAHIDGHGQIHFAMTATAITGLESVAGVGLDGAVT